MSPSQYDTLTEAINHYESAVDDALVLQRRPFILDLILMVIIPVALSIVALRLGGSTIGFGTTLGVGGINAEERLRRGQTTLKSYWGECSRLKKSVKRLKFELLLCSPSNSAGLKKIERRLRAYFDALP